MGNPCRGLLDREQLVFGDDLPQGLDVGKRRHAELGVGNILRPLEFHKDVTALVFRIEGIAAVCHTVQRRGVEEGTALVKIKAELIEQTEGERLIVHTRPRIEQLVATAIKGKRRVASELTDHRRGLTLQYLHVMRRREIIVAGKEEFLPDEDALAVADLVEALLRESRAAPHPKDIHVAVLRKQDQLLVALTGDIAPEQLGIDPVRALGHDAAAVQLDGCRHLVSALREDARAVRSRIPHKAKAAEADRSAPLLPLVTDDPGVKIRLALPVTPPKMRMLYGKGRLASAVDLVALAVKEKHHARERRRIGAGDFAALHRLVETAQHLAVADVALSARFNIGLVPKARDQQTGIPVPAVIYRRITGGIGLVTRSRLCALALRMGINMHDEGVATREAVGDVDLRAAEHALVRINAFSVQQNIVAVADALRDEEDPLARLLFKAKTGSVFKMIVL